VVSVATAAVLAVHLRNISDPPSRGAARQGFPALAGREDRSIEALPGRAALRSAQDGSLAGPPAQVLRGGSSVCRSEARELVELALDVAPPGAWRCPAGADRGLLYRIPRRRRAGRHRVRPGER